MIKNLLILFLFIVWQKAEAQQKTYCNPINIDYGYTPIPNFSEPGRHRATADPVITCIKEIIIYFPRINGDIGGVSDMLNWHFISRSFLKPYHHVYDDLCAPATLVLGDTLLVIGSTYTRIFRSG